MSEADFVGVWQLFESGPFASGRISYANFWKRAQKMILKAMAVPGDASGGASARAPPSSRRGYDEGASTAPRTADEAIAAWAGPQPTPRPTPRPAPAKITKRGSNLLHPHTFALTPAGDASRAPTERDEAAQLLLGLLGAEVKRKHPMLSRLFLLQDECGDGRVTQTVFQRILMKHTSASYPDVNLCCRVFKVLTDCSR